MIFFASWLGRKKASLCILAGICSISLCVIISSGGNTGENAGSSYVVKITHYGLDAKEVERSITIPLEDALSAIAGVRTVQSSSENSHSRVFVSFKRGGRGRYEAVRDAAQRVYETLPSSAQRPEILNSANSRVPVWSAAVFAADTTGENNGAVAANNSESVADVARILERIIKPKLESLEGAGEVLVSGTGLWEIVIVFDQEKLAGLGLDPSQAAATLRMNDALFSGGTLVQQDREIIITVDGRYDPVPDTALIPLGEGKTARLSEIALITEQERMPDTLSRLNGRKTAVISIMGSHSADLRKLSREIKRELSALSGPLEFVVLSDMGAEEAAAFRSVFSAAVQGALMVALLSFFLNGKKPHNTIFSLNHTGFFCALAVPSVLLVSAALLTICGFPIDRLVLAGIAAGAGTAVDPVILCTEKLRKCGNYSEASRALSELRGPLAAGAITTVVALLPLSAIEGSQAGIIARAIAAVTLAALVLSLTVLPPLLLWDMDRASQKQAVVIRKPPLLIMRIYRRFSRLLARFLAIELRYCVRHPIRIVCAGLLLTAAAVLALFVRGVDTGSYGSEDSVYAQIEFDGGLLAEEADRLLAAYSETLASQKGIRNVETGARTGSGSLLVSFDPKLTRAHVVRELARQIPVPGGFLFFPENSTKDRYWEIRITGDEDQKCRELARQIPVPGGFLFFPENSANDRYWEIRITGDEDQKCRELAEELARLSVGLPLIRERVLNFKPGSKKLFLLPDRERFAETGAVFSNAADKVRLGVYGPVIYKRVNTAGEIDVRIRTDGADKFNIPVNQDGLGQTVMRQTREGALGLLVSVGNDKTNASVRIDSLMRTREEIESASLRRIDRRRMASITVTTGPMDPRRVKQSLSGLFRKMVLPPGYSIEFDPDAIQQAQALSGTIISLLLAVAFCYMVIASINESFTVPLLVLCAIPPSLAVPALCMALSGGAFNLPSACAFIAVSGMTVNAAVLCVDGLRSAIQKENADKYRAFYRVLRRKMPALFATTGTTIAGALPFLFLREGANTMIRTLSLVGALGVASSCFCSISVVPALSLILKKYLKHVVPWNNFACAEWKI